MGTSYGQPPTEAFCPNCKTQLHPGQRFCPACGQVATAPGWSLDGTVQSPPSGVAGASAGTVPWTDPAVPPYAAQGGGEGTGMRVAPMPPGFQTRTYGGQPQGQGQPWMPYAPTEFSPGPAPTPLLTRQVMTQPTKRRKRKLIAAISAACLLVLLLAATAYLYNTFAAQAQIGAARYLPGDTVAYGSIDLIAAATNGYNYDPRTLNSSTGGASQDSIQKATGLNWQADVLPWLGREIAFGVFPKADSATSGGTSANPGDRFGEALLLQSRDDGKAQAAATKAANYLKQQGQSVSQETYGGMTVYADQVTPGSGLTVFVAGKGWVILASDSSSAHVVIDRLNGASGSNGTLAESAEFQTATKNLPSGRFGTLFVNVKALVRATMPQATQASLPFVNMYPTAGGYLSWTSQGLRAQVTFVSNGSAGVGDLGGDTTSLASMIPAHPVYYVGIANLGTTLQASEKLMGTGAADPADPAETLFGVPATDPALQQPAAVAFGAANGAPSMEIALKAPDASAAQSLLRSAAQAHGWTLKPATVGGVPVTAVYGTPGSFFGTGSSVTSYPPPSASSTAILVGDEQPSVVGYAGMVKGTLVFASTSADFTTVALTAQGAGPALASQDTFEKLERQAPQNAASTAFVDVSSVGALARGSTAASGLSARLTAVLLTEVWNNQESQTTVDAQLQQ